MPQNWFNLVTKISSSALLKALDWSLSAWLRVTPFKVLMGSDDAKLSRYVRAKTLKEIESQLIRRREIAEKIDELTQLLEVASGAKIVTEDENVLVDRTEFDEIKIKIDHIGAMIIEANVRGDVTVGSDTVKAEEKPAGESSPVTKETTGAVSASAVAARRVRIGIIAKDPPTSADDADVLPRSQPLVRGTTYFLRVDISAEREASNVVNPVDIPPDVLKRVPGGDKLDVWVSSSDFEVAKEGNFSGFQQIELKDDYASTFAYVRVTTPERLGLARLRVCVYYRNNLLQWLRTRVRVIASSDGDDWGAETLISSRTIALRAFEEEGLQILVEEGISRFVDLIPLADERIEQLAKRLNIDVEEFRNWRGDVALLLGVRSRHQVERILKSKETPAPLGNESIVVYTINSTFIGFRAYENPTIGIELDSAQRTVSVKGTDFSKPDIPLAKGLGKSLSWFHKFMQELNEPEEGIYGFPYNKGHREDIEETLLKLAERGWNVFTALFNDTMTRRKLRTLLKAPSAISVSEPSPSNDVVPWNALYDLPVAKEWQERTFGLRRAVCMRWCNENHQKLTVLGRDLQRRQLDFETCFQQAECPRHRRTNEDKREYLRRISCNVCVFGFWGFKHRIQKPPGGVEGYQENRVDGSKSLRPHIIVKRHPDVCVIGNPTIQFADSHCDRLRELANGPLRPRVVAADKASDIEGALCDPSSHVIYFYCHGGLEDDEPCLVVGHNDMFVSGSYLAALDLQWPNNPLIFVNGCETVRYSPNAITSLAIQFRGLDASGVIGAETKVFPLLARWFGEEFLKRFLNGDKVGDIMVELRLELLQQFNPLGLIYTSHSFGGLQLVPEKLVQHG